MIAADNTQSLSEFRKTAAATIARLNETGDAEIITVNGQAKAVLLSPAAYDEMARNADTARDVAMIRKAMEEFDQGKGRPIREFSAMLRAELVAKKGARRRSAVK